jgi:hypothetical protein
MFTLPRAGLMAQVSIDGQKFNYKPLDSTDALLPLIAEDAKYMPKG